MNPAEKLLGISLSRMPSLPIFRSLLLCVLALPAAAQMVPGSRVVGEAAGLGLDRDRRARDYSLQELSCSAPSNVLWPGEQPTVTLRLTNLTAALLTASGTLHIIQYATRGRPGDIWQPDFVQIREVDALPLAVSGLASKTSVELSFSPKIPETFGGYLLVADLPGHGRAFAASLVRTLQPDNGVVQFPAYGLDLNGTSEAVARFFMRTGVKGARMEVSPFAADDKDFAQKWDKLTKTFRTLKENEITLMVTISAGSLPMPLGCPRPHLSPDGTFLETKSDWSWLPSADPAFEKWVKDVSAEFGWPKGPVNAFELWNEPWEGISISGWGADMLRYREIYTAMARGIEAARAEDGAKVLMGGCGSSSNTIDKLFGDGSDEFLKWLDFCSIHYQTMAATPALMRNFVNRPGGPVRVWDTESWVANSEDRVGLVVASMHAMGQERAMGVYAGNAYDPQTVTLDGGRKETVVQAWSPAAAVAASTKFVGQRKFRELLFQNGLPWVFVFDGRPEHGEDDGTVVVAGDLSGCYSRNLLLFRTVYGLQNAGPVRKAKAELAALPATAGEAERKALAAKLDAASVLQGGNLTISDGGGHFVLMDFYGNQVPAKDGRITVPLNGYGYYLRTDGTAGSFAKLLEELRGGRIEGYQPIEIIPHDFTTAVGPEAAFRLTLTNVLNRPVTGKLSASIAGVDLPGASQTLTLAPHDTRELSIKAGPAKAAPDNIYPLRVTFDAGADGVASQEEKIRANVVARKTITVDGKLDDWAGVIPLTLAATGIGANLTEKAWLPFAKFDESTAQGLATGYVAYDDRNFYFAARIADATPDEGMVRFEKRNDDAYFYPPVAQRYNETATLLKTEKMVENARFKEQPLALPGGKERGKVVWESVSKAFAFDLALPADKAQQVALYFLSWDPLGRHSVTVEISDPAMGKVLLRQAIRDFGDGKYALFDLSGTVRVKIWTNVGWLKAVASGIFFDPAKEAKPVHGTTAAFVGVDDHTHGNWAGVYGMQGFAIAGGPEKLPAFAKLAFSTEVQKEELKWPEGMRRFSYRQRPDLPAAGPESHDNVQIAFNVLPDDRKPWLPSPPGTPPHWMMYYDTDYEYALNQVAAKYGGGTEIWRLQVPGMPTKHFYPRQPKSPFDGPVQDGQLAMRRDGNTRIVELALPWSEIPEVKKRLAAGEKVKFDFRVNDNGGPSFELADGRAVSKFNSTTFHNNWQTHWANELEFGFEK